MGDRDESIEELFENYGYDPPILPEKRYWDHLTLQDIVDLAPPEAKLSDIYLKIRHPRMLEYVEVTFKYIQRNTEKEFKNFEKDLKKYKKEFPIYEEASAKYNKEVEEYHDWVKRQEIEKLEARLKELKK